MYDDIPPYLAQQNPFMGQYAEGPFNAATAYITPMSMYGPTYGQFGPESYAMMPTPYGGMLQPPSVNPYYLSMVKHPIKGFFTYNVPIFMAPKGISPALLQNYQSELRFETYNQLMSFGTATAGSLLGGAIAGLPGAIIGGFAGILWDKTLGSAAGRTIQIHEAGNMLNMSGGISGYGIGISMSQASDLYRMFTKEGAHNANFTAEEYQLTFNELAKNALIDDMGDFSQVKYNLKKMKNIVEKLQDLFQNGDIKSIVASLRQLRMIGVGIDDIATISSTSALAATVMGQKATDYITNAIGEATQYSSTIGISRSGLLQFRNVLTIGMANDDSVDALKEFMPKGVSRKDAIERLLKIFEASLQEQANPEVAKNILSMNGLTAQQYIVASLEAGIQKYNKENGTHYTLREVLARNELREKIAKEYATPGFEEIMSKHNGNLKDVLKDLKRSDNTFSYIFYDQTAIMEAAKKVKNPMSMLVGFMDYMLKHEDAWETLLTRYPQLTPNTDKLLEIAKQNPQMLRTWQNITTRKTQMQEKEQENLKFFRQTSVTGRWEEFKQSMQNMFAETLNNITPEVRAYGIMRQPYSNITLATFIEAQKKFKTISLPEDLTNDAMVFDEIGNSGRFLSGLKIKAFGEGILSKNQKLIAERLGWSTLNLGMDEMKGLWAYKRLALDAYSKYASGVEQFIANPNSKEGQDFLMDYTSYFQGLKSPIAPGIYGKDDITVKDKQAEMIFKELTNEVKRLSEEMRKLINKPDKTSEDIKKIMEYKDKIDIAKRSMLELYRGDNFGPTAMFKMAGVEITKDRMQEFAQDLAKLKKNSPDLYEKAIEGYANALGIKKDVAKHTFEQLIKNKDNEDVFAMYTIKGADLTMTGQTPLVFNGAAAAFATSGGAQILAKGLANVKSVDQLLNVFSTLHSLTKKYDFEGSEDSQKILKSLIINNAQLKGLGKEQQQQIIQVYQEMQSRWKEFTGGHAFKVGNKEVNTWEDFINLSKKEQKEILNQINSTAIVASAANRLGIDVASLDKSGRKALQELFTNVFEYKNGKFEFKGSEAKAEKYIAEHTELQKLLKSAGFDNNTASLMKLKASINDDAASKIEVTNEILNKIYRQLVKMSDKKSGASGFFD